jgi:hypothetical protein
VLLCTPFVLILFFLFHSRNIKVFPIFLAIHHCHHHLFIQVFADAHLPEDMGALGKRVCMARFINHACDASMRVVIQPPPPPGPPPVAPPQLSASPPVSAAAAAATETETAPDSSPSSFAIPGAPYSRGRGVRAFHLITRRDVLKDTELTLNYFLLPGYMAKVCVCACEMRRCFDLVRTQNKRHAAK